MSPKLEPANLPVIRLTLNSNLTAGGLATAAILLGTAYIIIYHIQACLPEHPLYGLPRFFDLGMEGNLPSYFSALCLLSAGGASLLIASADTARQKLGWKGLGFGFIYLSFDEAAQIHDGIISPVFNSMFGSFKTPAFHYGWVVVALGAISVLVPLYIGFLTRLPRSYAVIFIISGFIYVGGAVGMEMVEAHFAATGHWPQGLFPWRAVAEELGEMLGVILFLHTAMRYLTHLGCSWNLSWSQSKVRNY